MTDSSRKISQVKTGYSDMHIYRLIDFAWSSSPKMFYQLFLYYCSSVWHFCSARNADKVGHLNKRILSFILQDYSSPHDILLSKVNVKSLFIRRLQNFMIILYKDLFFTNYPSYLKDMFTVRSSSYNLRGNHILALPNPKTTNYDLHSFSYLASKIWNSLPDTYKTLNFLEFKQEILRQEAFPQQIYKLYFPLDA